MTVSRSPLIDDVRGIVVSPTVVYHSEWSSYLIVAARPVGRQKFGKLLGRAVSAVRRSFPGSAGVFNGLLPRLSSEYLTVIYHRDIGLPLLSA